MTVGWKVKSRFVKTTGEKKLQAQRWERENEGEKGETKGRDCGRRWRAVAVYSGEVSLRHANIPPPPFSNCSAFLTHRCKGAKYHSRFNPSHADCICCQAPFASLKTFLWQLGAEVSIHAAVTFGCWIPQTWEFLRFFFFFSSSSFFLTFFLAPWLVLSFHEPFCVRVNVL